MYRIFQVAVLSAAISSASCGGKGSESSSAPTPAAGTEPGHTAATAESPLPHAAADSAEGLLVALENQLDRAEAEARRGQARGTTGVTGGSPNGPLAAELARARPMIEQLFAMNLNQQQSQRLLQLTTRQQTIRALRYTAAADTPGASVR